MFSQIAFNRDADQRQNCGSQPRAFSGAVGGALANGETIRTTTVE